MLVRLVAMLFAEGHKCRTHLWRVLSEVVTVVMTTKIRPSAALDVVDIHFSAKVKCTFQITRFLQSNNGTRTPNMQFLLTLEPPRSCYLSITIRQNQLSCRPTAQYSTFFQLTNFAHDNFKDI